MESSNEKRAEEIYEQLDRSTGFYADDRDFLIKDISKALDEAEKRAIRDTLNGEVVKELVNVAREILDNEPIYVELETKLEVALSAFDKLKENGG